MALETVTRAARFSFLRLANRQVINIFLFFYKSMVWNIAKYLLVELKLGNFSTLLVKQQLKMGGKDVQCYFFSSSVNIDNEKRMKIVWFHLQEHGMEYCQKYVDAV